jgi:ATP-dependent exoDNAse (exonuclease V) beta subunit
VREVPKDAGDAVRAYDAAIAAVQEAAISPFRSPSLSHERLELVPAERTKEDYPESDFPSGRDLGMAAGRLIHLVLEHWDGASSEQALSRLRALAGTVARESGVDAADLGRQAEEILNSFLASPLASLYREVETVGREVGLLLRAEEGRLYRGSIDLLYRDGGGELVVADYKTDSETDVAKLRERYHEQLGVYAEAVRRALQLPSPPRAELWMLRSGLRVRVEARN